MGGFIVNIWILIAGLISIATTVIAAILIIKGVTYFKRAEAREIERDQREAQTTIDDIEQELNSRKD